MNLKMQSIDEWGHNMPYMNTVMSGIEAYMYIWGVKPIVSRDIYFNASASDGEREGTLWQPYATMQEAMDAVEKTLPAIQPALDYLAKR